MSADYNAGDLLLTLTFDRAVDVSGIVPGELVVDDGNLDIEMGGTAEVAQPTPQAVLVVMVENGEFTGEGVTLTAGPGNGIVAVDDGGTWAGVEGLALPFP